MDFVTRDERAHRVITRSYDDETLDLVTVTLMPEPGWQLNGHRMDCRCETCRPDIFRLPEAV